MFRSIGHLVLVAQFAGAGSTFPSPAPETDIEALPRVEPATEKKVIAGRLTPAAGYRAAKTAAKK